VTVEPGTAVLVSVTTVITVKVTVAMLVQVAMRSDPYVTGPFSRQV
jgi:hypothetical protein